MNSFIFLNTLKSEDLKIRLLESGQYSGMTVVVRRCESYDVNDCEKHDEAMTLKLQGGNEFHFNKYHAVGNFIKRFQYYEL